MESLGNFFESSTIHGLTYISTTRNCVRLFWIAVVVAGFTGAGVIIYQSFQEWNESPVKTTVETQAISEITFPKVTVCPPKNTYTDLNYDLMRMENMTLDKKTRQDLVYYAMELMWDDYHHKVMINLSKLQDNDRYYNWYHGFTKINIALNEHTRKCSIKQYASCEEFSMETSALSGNIFTQYFGDSFDVDKVETDLYYSFQIYPPTAVGNTTLHMNFEKISLLDLASGMDNLYHENDDGKIEQILKADKHKRHKSIKYPPPGNRKFIKFDRHIIQDDTKQALQHMPGIRVFWHYTGRDVVPEAKYSDDVLTKLFVRYAYIAIALFSIFDT